MASERPAVTVGIATWSRPREACRTAEAVAAQLGPADRCILVVQGDSADQEAFRVEAGSHKALGDPRITIVAESRPSLTRARNIVLRQSGTPLVAFLDDDAVPRPAWLEAVRGALEESDLVAGRVVEDPPSTVNDPSMRGGRLTWAGRTRRNYVAAESGPTQLVQGANMAMRRDLAMEAGGFEEAITGSAHYEDVEFSLRLRRLGARVWYAADAEVDHLAVRTGAWWGDDSKKRVELARHMSLVFRRHRPLLWPVMVVAWIGSTKWKILQGRLPLRVLLAVGAAIMAGRREGAMPVKPMTG